MALSKRFVRCSFGVALCATAWPGPSDHESVHASALGNGSRHAYSADYGKGVSGRPRSTEVFEWRQKNGSHAALWPGRFATLMFAIYAQTRPDGAVVYFHAEALTTHTTHPNGLEYVRV